MIIRYYYYMGYDFFGSGSILQKNNNFGSGFSVGFNKWKIPVPVSVCTGFKLFRYRS